MQNYLTQKLIYIKICDTKTNLDIKSIGMFGLISGE